VGVAVLLASPLARAGDVLTGVAKIKSVMQTVRVGGLAAGVAYALAKLIS
jgi:hypothetical protein